MAYRKMQHPASGYAVVADAAVVVGVCTGCRVAATGVGAKATRLGATEQALVGQALTPEAIVAAAKHAGDDVEFLGDIYASEAYCAQLLKVYARRALLAAAEAAH